MCRFDPGFLECRLCPRECRVNRFEAGKGGYAGFCRQNHELRVAYIGPHFGEEPPLTGTRGSGTVFFSGCSLRCSFCQNYQISRDGMGRTMEIRAVFKSIVEMIEKKKVHNINFVTPDHFFPYVFRLVPMLRKEGCELPIVYNLSGYQSVEMLRIANEYSDIYLPDFKYSDPALSARLSKCKNYPEVALQAIAEMIKQKGFLDTFETGAPLARKGVLVRHLILPGKVQNSINALTTLFLEFGPLLPISLMSQYTPVVPAKDPDLNRTLTPEEFDQVYSHALSLGFERLFVQFPEKNHSQDQFFVPDFTRDKPFPTPASHDSQCSSGNNP